MVTHLKAYSRQRKKVSVSRRGNTQLPCLFLSFSLQSQPSYPPVSIFSKHPNFLFVHLSHQICKEIRDIWIWLQFDKKVFELHLQKRNFQIRVADYREHLVSSDLCFISKSIDGRQGKSSPMSNQDICRMVYSIFFRNVYCSHCQTQ